jgi:predicted membrane metal-binding protein
MLAGTLAFATGIFCSLQVSFLPSFGPTICLPVLFILGRWAPVVRYLLIFLLGFYWSLLLISNAINDDFHTYIEGAAVELTGVVSSLPETYAGHIQFMFDVETLVDSKDKHYESPGTVRLS